MSEIKKVESEDLKIIKVDHVKNLLNAGPTLKQIVKDNPFIDPNETNIDVAETSRKALKLGRTTVNNHEKDIKSGLSKASKAIKAKAEELRLIIEPAEQKQSEANNAYFDNKAWIEAQEINTKQAYLGYMKDFEFHLNEATIKIQEIEAAEEQAKKVYQNWSDEMYKIIAAAQNLDDLDKIGQKLDAEDLERFFDAKEAFETREKLYNIIDINKASFEKLERERIEREKLEKEREALNLRNDKRNEELRPYIVFIRDYNALLQSEENEYQKELTEIKTGAKLQKEFELKQKKEAEEQTRKDREEAARLKAEAEKKAEDDKILKQLENYNNAVETFELIAMSIPGINEVEQLNIYSGKIEGLIEKDFGDNETDIKERYETFNIILTNRRDTLNAELQKQKAIDAQKLQEEQPEAPIYKEQSFIHAPSKTSNHESDADKLKSAQDKAAEVDRLKDVEYKEAKAEAFESFVIDVSEDFMVHVGAHKNDIEVFKLKDDIIQYISDLLI